MFVKDPFLHSTYIDSGDRFAILKSEIIAYQELKVGTRLTTKTTGCIIAMPYDEVKAALTVTVC